MVDSIRTARVGTVTKASAIRDDKPGKPKKSGNEKQKEETVTDEAQQTRGSRIDERC